MVWDKSELLLRVMNNDEIIPVLLNAFLEDAPNTLNALKSALDQGDMVLLNRQAHTIKGMAANLAAEPLAEIAYAIEQVCKGESSTELPALVSELERRFEQVIECFRKELST